MIGAFYKDKRWATWAWGGGALLVLSLWVQVQITVAINSWYGGFYNLLQKAGDYKDNAEEGVTLFYNKLISVDYLINGLEGEPSFAVLAFPYVLLAVATGWFTRIYGLRWR